MDANSMCNSKQPHDADAVKLKAIDTSRCPLCGRGNQCTCAASACHDDAASCWCMNASISQQLLDRIPSELRGLACVCPLCVESYHKGQHV